MAAKKKAGGAGRAAALPLQLLSFVEPGHSMRFVSPELAGRSPRVVAGECFVELVDALKKPDIRLTAVDVAQLVKHLAESVRDGCDVAHWLLYQIVQMSAVLIRDVGNPQWPRDRLAEAIKTETWLAEMKAKAKAEAVARLAAGRKAAAERRAIAALTQFPRGVGASA